MEEISEGLSRFGSYIFSNLPSAASVSGLFFYSFVTYLFLFCMRYARNEVIYPRMEKNISDTVNRKREENRAERGREAQRLAEKLE
jgi:hypothetical protein